MKIDAAIFDLDGTLLDSMPMWRRLDEDLLGLYGYTLRPGSREILLPLPLEEAIAWMKKEYALPVTVEALKEQVYALAREYYLNRSRLKEGALDFVDRLYRRGLPMVAATATDRALVEPALKRLELEERLRGLITCAEAGAGKQQPVIFQKARQMLGDPQGDVWVFEDSATAAATAQRAGFLVAGIADEDGRDDWPLLQENADAFFYSWQQASEFFGLA